MSDKHFSVILTVDLSCQRCHEKIKKVLAKHQDGWDIQSVVWDEKNNKITLTGPFCSRKLSKRLCRKARKIIKAIDVPDLCDCEEEKPKPAEPKPDPPKPAPPKPAEPKLDPPKPAEPKKDPPKAEPPKPAEPKKDPPKAEPPKPAPPAPAPKLVPAPAPEPSKPAPPPAPEPAVVPDPYPYPPMWPVCFGGPWCDCGGGGGYCAPCGCGCGGGHQGYGRPCHGGSRVEFFCEEESACRPM